MPDWRALVRARLHGSGLNPTTEIDVVDEMAQHLEDRYDELRAGGMTDAEAQAQSLRELDGDELLEALSEILPREES